MLCSVHAAYTKHDKFQGLGEESLVNFNSTNNKENAEQFTEWLSKCRSVNTESIMLFKSKF